MLALMQDYDFEISQVMNLLWLNEQEVIRLAEMGHSIGLHSYSHPTMMHKLSLSAQQEEYKKNYAHLADLVGEQHLYSSEFPFFKGPLCSWRGLLQRGHRRLLPSSSPLSGT